MQLGLIVLTLLISSALIIFLVYRSRIDRKTLEEELYHDFEVHNDTKDENRYE
ncbi:hypothetical protein [Sediminibacterium sp. KACHI17]|jgi:hypothetical protein|uniref:hypothetical protein n=1 Tax=Sediminibacterium sp. KACHI17 TaxID=1751071 RepID=UPI0033659FC9